MRKKERKFLPAKLGEILAEAKELREDRKSKELQQKAEQYGVTRLPAVAVDGKLLECCSVAPVSQVQLRNAGLGAV